MGPMGHEVPTMIGVDHKGVAEKIRKLVPDYMVMGDKGMADMGEMEMPIPDNTVPMMTGTGPFGSAEMGGMFTLLKVRRDQKPGDYRDPGWFRHPPGTVAREVPNANVPPAPRAKAPAPSAAEPDASVRKPSGHGAHQH